LNVLIGDLQRAGPAAALLPGIPSGRLMRFGDRFFFIPRPLRPIILALLVEGGWWIRQKP